MPIRRSGAFHVVHTGVQPRADGLLGGILPILSLPGVGDVTSVLGLPGPTTSATPSLTTTSVSVRTRASTSDAASLTTSPSLTTSITPTVSTTSSDTQTTSSSVSTTSTSDTTSTTSFSTTSSLPSTSDTATVASAPTDSATTISSQHTVTFTASNSSSSSSAAPTAQPDNAPKSFLQNKALSVGVITAATFVGLVLLIALATWALRKRRNDRIDQDILDFSTAGLANESRDMEKGGSGYGGGVGSVETSSVDHGSDSSLVHGNSIPPSRQMYQGAGYGAAVYGVPSRQPSRSQHPYGGQAAYGGAYGAYQQPNYGYQQPNNTYDNWNYGYAAYDQAYGGTDDAYAGYADTKSNADMTGVGAGAQQPTANPPQRRPSAQRKPAPQLNIPAENPISVASPESTVSLNNPPLQAAASTNSTNPPPAAGSAGSASGNYPNLPAPGPLPDEFGVSVGSPTEVREPRRLIVRNE